MSCRNAVFYISGGGSLTVQDGKGGGKIVQPNGGQVMGVSYGTLTVKSGTIKVESDDTSNDDSASRS